MANTRQQRAFTLVELSIVLVILGLLVGGVLTGQSLIRAAELRSISAQYQTYMTATQTFRDKYFALPGDMTNATRYWGRLNSNSDCVTNSAAATSASGVCDGNGDGIVLWDNGGSAGVSKEMHQFWRHLAAAGLIEGNYTGVAGAGNGASVTIGENAPRARINAAGWGMGGQNAGSTAGFDIAYGNYFTFGTAWASNTPIGSALKAEEAYNIDTKMDDGKPATGKLIDNYAINGTYCTTAANRTDFTATYKLSDTTIACSFYFVQQF